MGDKRVASAGDADVCHQSRERVTDPSGHSGWKNSTRAEKLSPVVAVRRNRRSATSFWHGGVTAALSSTSPSVQEYVTSPISARTAVSGCPPRSIFGPWNSSCRDGRHSPIPYERSPPETKYSTPDVAMARNIRSEIGGKCPFGLETCHAQTLHELTLVSLTVLPRPTGSCRWPPVTGSRGGPTWLAGKRRQNP